MAQYDNKRPEDLVRIEDEIGKRLDAARSDGEKKHLAKELRRIRRAMEQQTGAASVPVLGTTAPATPRIARPVERPIAVQPPTTRPPSAPAARVTAQTTTAPASRPTPSPAPTEPRREEPRVAPPSTGRGPVGPVGIELDQLLASIGDDAMAVL